ncbi:MAG: DUF3124 domain-containing protein [Candidatus Latescibacterota bacterium]|nr:DUF3124 domain-containing protein [Candidatus Latescibacterota bacterium]MEE3039649.1 DUF3124 domain-containing protein [Candidatus Latescibacterota bacterium]
MLHDLVDQDVTTACLTDVGAGALGDHHVIYVPTYSHVSHGENRVQRLMTTLSVHNISFRESINVHKVRYYNTQGRLVHDFVKKNISLSLMQTYQVQVLMNDTTSLGANFLVEWEGPPVYLLPWPKRFMSVVEFTP